MTLTTAAVVLFCRWTASVEGHTRCESAVRATVTAIEREATAQGVDPVRLASVCGVESRDGASLRAVSVCGVRVGHQYVRDPVRAVQLAAHSLARWERECRDRSRAVGRYHGEGCRGDSSYVRGVLAIERRLRCTMATGRRC